MKMRTSYQEMRSARREVLCGKKECTDGGGGTQNEKEFWQI